MNKAVNKNKTYKNKEDEKSDKYAVEDTCIKKYNQNE